MLDAGYYTLFRVHGIPVRLHWTAPLGAIFFSGFAFAPGFWLGYLVLILCHELGHAFLVRRYRMRVPSVDVHGMGGLCHIDGSPTPVQSSVIAWGGVLAQFMLLVPALVVVIAGLAPRVAFVQEFLLAFTRANVMLILLNLLPIPPLDGAEAWKLFSRLKMARAARARSSVAKAVQLKQRAPARVAPEDAVIEDTVAEMLRKAQEDAREARRRNSLH